MADPVKPADYIFSDIPITTKASFSATANARVRQTCKSAIQHYLDSYLNSQGCYRRQLLNTAPFAGIYVTDVGSAVTDDPLRHQVLLGRLWERLKGQLPAIVISDGGWEPQPIGLGNVETGFNIDGWTSALSTTVLGTMTVEILTAAIDEGGASDLADVLTYILGPLTMLNKAWLIRSNRVEDQWEVRLPKGGPSASPVEKSAIDGDTTSVMWSSTVTLEVEFEGRVSIGIDNELNPAQMDRIQNDSNFQVDVPLARASYQVPTQVRFGVQTPIQFQTLPYGSRFISDNPRIAIVDDQGCIRATGFGTFNVLLVGKPPVDGLGEILARHAVTVVTG